MSKGIKIDAVLGSTVLSIKDISNFEKGSVIDLGITAGENIKCYHGDNYLFSGEVMVFEKNLAVRVNGTSKECILQQVSNEDKAKFIQYITDDIIIPKEDKNNKETDFSYLMDIKPLQLSEFIMNEHPQTIALVLSNLSPDIAAKVLSVFPDELKVSVLMRMTDFGDISPKIIEQVSNILENKLKTLSSYKIEVGGKENVVSLLKNLSANESQSIINSISELDTTLANSLKEKF